VQKQQDGKKRSPLGLGPIAAHEYIAQDQLPVWVETTMEPAQQGTVFINPVGV
jgi:hypothetical protein